MRVLPKTFITDWSSYTQENYSMKNVIRQPNMNWNWDEISGKRINGGFFDLFSYKPWNFEKLVENKYFSTIENICEFSYLPWKVNAYLSLPHKDKLRFNHALTEIYCQFPGKKILGNQRMDSFIYSVGEELYTFRLNYPTEKQLESKPECSVCLEDCDTTRKCRVLNCGHFFHKVCIDKWVRGESSCPMCRRKIHTDYTLIKV
jgi:hypothetical protein